MPFPLSPQTIDTLADIITGGSGMGSGPPPIGIYRSGPQIERFMRGCNVDFRVNGSRVPSLTTCLLDMNRGFECQSAPKTDPGSASNFDPPVGRDQGLSRRNFHVVEAGQALISGAT